MKKVLTFVVMLGCTLVASAQLSKGVQKELPSQFTQPELGIKVHPADNPFIKVPTDLQLPEDGLRLPFDIAPAQNMSRKAAMAAITATADTAKAMYLGNYFYAYYKQWYGDIWQLTIWDTNKNKWMIQFTGTSAKRLDGEYTDASLTYVAGIDTIKATGTFNIKFAGTVMEKPTYKFSGAFSNTAGNTLTLNENPLAYTFPDNNTTTKDFWVFDYIYYYYCVAQGQLCGYVGIDLEDKEVEPTGDTIDIEITGAAVQKAYADGYYVGAQDESTYFSTFLLTDGATPVGHYDAEAIDLTQTQYYDMSDTSLVEIYKGISADVTATENGYNYIVRVMDMNGIQYNFIFDYVKPVITDTVKMSLTNATFKKVLTPNYYQLVAMDSTSTQGLQMIFAASDTIVGKYTEKDAYYGGKYDIIMMVDDKKDTTIYSIGSYKMVVIDMMAMSYPYYGFSIEATGTNADDKTDMKIFKITSVVYNTFAYDNTSNVSQTFDTTYSAFSTKYYAQNGEVDFYAQNANGYIKLAFFPTDTVAGTILAEGTYPITNTGTNLALASTGLQTISSQQIAMPCSMVLFDNQGYRYDWYFVSGNITIAKNIITVAAYNSKKAKIDVVITLGQPTGFEAPAMNNAACAGKIMKDGQLYIVNGDALYNMQGFEVK